MFMPHLEIVKLFESADIIGVKHNFNAEEVVGWARELIKADGIKDALIRVLLIGQEDGFEPFLFLFPVGLTFYPKVFYKHGVKVITYNGERFMPASKTKNLLLNYIAYREAAKQKAIDALLVDRFGNICEGTRSSFFVIQNNTLIMPPREKVLEGVTRKTIMDIAPKIMNVKEQDIPLEMINQYDECFISATTMDIMPVSQINDVKLRQKAGEKVKSLQELYKDLVEKKPNRNSYYV